MTTPRISYRHARATAKPYYVSGADVAQVAAAVRGQLGYRDHHARIDYREIARARLAPQRERHRRRRRLGFGGDG